MSAPIVSVIVTVHRRLDFLAEALESVRAQTFEDYEVIVVDDSGCGAASAVTKPFLEDERLRYVANQETFGVALSLQKTLQSARGKYIAILNDDDLWEPEFLSRLVPALNA